ncbi:MAG: hypothetical protein F6K19_42635 [Cyanothece sp. SIO1E1]|nr:hypothetical protein [Cyanothece sp. SIO1E1]
MNTQSHAVLNLALLSQQFPASAALTIAIGAILPDAPMFVLYAWAKLIRRQSEYQIWTETYNLPFWQNIIATFHSIPLALLGFVVAYYANWQVAEILCLSMVLHALLDLPVHSEDAHRHFFPFSHYRFISPISYWDPRYHGAIVAGVEKLLVLAATLYVFPLIHSPIGRGILVAINLLHLIIIVYLRVVKPRFLASG